VAGSLGGLEVRFISRALLIRNKRAAQRDKDLADIRLLEQTQPERPDD
jgi:hypothetical protein